MPSHDEHCQRSLIFARRIPLAGARCSIYVLNMFDPKFAHGAALFIIWRRPRTGGMETIAAGTHRAMRGAWDAIQDQYPDDELTLQHRARVIERREQTMGRDFERP